MEKYRFRSPFSARPQVGALVNENVTRRVWLRFLSISVLTFAVTLLTLTATGCDDECEAEAGDININEADINPGDDTGQGLDCSSGAVKSKSEEFGNSYCGQYYTPGPPPKFKNPKTGKVCKGVLATAAFGACTSIAEKKAKNAICGICALAGTPCAEEAEEA